MIFDKGLRTRREPVNAVSASSIGLMSSPGAELCTADSAMRLADVSRCIDILSDDMAKLPFFMMNEESRKREYGGNTLRLLRQRPNEAMTPFTLKKLVECNIHTGGNGYIWIVRSPRTMEPGELIPIPFHLVTPHREANGLVWYSVTNPITGELMRLFNEDMIHIKGFSYDGLTGISTLQRARDVVEAGIAAQRYQISFYRNGGRPSGVLQLDADLDGVVETVVDGQVVKKSKKDIVRDEWDRVHSGPNNGHRIAILDHGLKYNPITISQADAQFVETKRLSRIDCANIFGVPLYKLNDGKQAYSSNEQNGVEYCVSTLQPKVTQWEEEFSFKLLTDDWLDSSWRLRMNMMAALRGDTGSRGAWYKIMREIGAFSVNDILALEDLPGVPGGDVRYASLNYTDLEEFRRQAKEKNGGNNGKS